jgi:L-ribulose-5-phosphate 4-epimerase
MVDVRQELWRLHAELPRHGLVTWTSGNLSARVDGGMVIKPSGVAYDELTPESMVLCDLDGLPLEDGYAPSSDAATHGFIYQQRPDVGGIVHTHSPCATAWAIRGEPIPCVMTAMADEFGGEIPVGPFALIGDDAIGRGVVDTLAGSRSCVVLMRAHGVFAVAESPRAAVKAAVMCEDAARTVLAARSLGPLEPLAPESVDALYHRYQNVYGQH